MKKIIIIVMILSVLLVSGGAVDKERALESKIDRTMKVLHENIGSKWKVE